MLNKKKFEYRTTSKSKSFLSKLYDILNNLEYEDIISWNINGTGIIIKNVIRFCEIVLPKFYKHNNYSSFVRQLNLYGFHKSQGILNEGEGFEHDNFCKDITKEEVKKIMIQNKRNRFIEASNNDIKNSESYINEIFSGNNENNILKLIFIQLEENSKNIKELKDEIKIINNQYKVINDNFNLFQQNFNGHSIFIQKIIKKNEENRKNSIKYPKSKNLKELFKNYLYYLKIYSPFVSIEINYSKTLKVDKSENTKKSFINYNNIKDILSNNNDNFENTFEDNYFFIQKQNMGSLELNLNNNNSSYSFLNYNKDIK